MTKQRQGIRPVIHIYIYIEHYYHYSGPGDADEHDHSSPICRQGSILVSLAKQCSCYCRSDFLHFGHSCRSPCRSGGTVDRTVRIWNTASMTQLQSFDTGSQVLLSSCYKSAEKLTLPCLQVSSIAWNSEYKEMITGHGFSHNQLTVWRYPR